MTARIGTSGWSYPDWDGVLYPPGTRAANRLEHYVARYGTVELNSSFYHWPPDTHFDGWARRLPPGFSMSLKAPRGLTHVKRLRDPEQWWSRIQRGMARLGDKSGVLLAQMPPDFSCQPERLQAFLAQLPAGAPPLALEFRHPDWHREEIFALLEQHGVAYCVMSGPKLPCVLRATASLVYVRLHGPDPEQLYVGDYPEQDLHWWAARVREWENLGKEVYVYFNNTADGAAVRNADRLKQLLL